MPLVLKYQDRYRLWNDLIRASTDRLFIATAEPPALHSQAPIEVQVPELVRPIVVSASIIGRRTGSRRFDSGVYVRIPEREVEKCRRFLGLDSSAAEHHPPRRAQRVHCNVAVRFVQPLHDRAFIARNLSEVGVMATAPKVVTAGQRVRVALDLAEHAVELDADVAWRSADSEHVGLNFVDVPDATRSHLHQAIAQLIEQKIHTVDGDPLPLVVADDEPEILNLISTALSRHGYKVYPAKTGDEALTLIQHLHPALVVMDILMPGLDGADVCKTMRSDAELADIPVIFVSALGSATLHAVADESGATDYLPKPLHLSELLNLIGGYLQPHASH